MSVAGNPIDVPQVYDINIKNNLAQHKDILKVLSVKDDKGTKFLLNNKNVFMLDYKTLRFPNCKSGDRIEVLYKPVPRFSALRNAITFDKSEERKNNSKPVVDAKDFNSRSPKLNIQNPDINFVGNYYERRSPTTLDLTTEILLPPTLEHLFCLYITMQIIAGTEGYKQFYQVVSQKYEIELKRVENQGLALPSVLMSDTLFQRKGFV